jgi:hypothetical protein
MPDMFKKLFPKNQAGLTGVIVVSGLPRSGTSMMMKMLVEGGLQVVTDALRSADDDNPNGYFEFEPVKQLAEGRDDWLENAQGRVVKVISALLEHLPARHHYKVIFMERSLQEVLASQKKMLSNRSEQAGTGDREMEEQFRKHLGAVKYWLARQPNVEVLYVDYNAMLVSPDDHCRRVAEFIGVPVDVEKMRSVPNERLYRNRAPG